MMSTKNWKWTLQIVYIANKAYLWTSVTYTFRFRQPSNAWRDGNWKQFRSNDFKCTTLNPWTCSFFVSSICCYGNPERILRISYRSVGYNFIVSIRRCGSAIQWQNDFDWISFRASIIFLPWRGRRTTQWDGIKQQP